MSLMRTYRRALGLSQSAFAAQLNVPLETYRPWDAGRREPPPQRLTRARTLAGYPDETVLLPLPVLALMIGVHVRTLHAAARSGRLVVAYDTRTTFRRLRPRATLKHALDFRRHYYGTQRRPPATPVPRVCVASGDPVHGSNDLAEVVSRIFRTFRSVQPRSEFLCR